MKKFLLASLVGAGLLASVTLGGNVLAEGTGNTTTGTETITVTETRTTGLEAFFSQVAQTLNVPIDQVKTALTEAWQGTMTGWDALMNSYGRMMDNSGENTEGHGEMPNDNLEQRHEQCEQMMGNSGVMMGGGMMSDGMMGAANPTTLY